MKGHIRQSGETWYVILPTGEKYANGQPRYKWHPVKGGGKQDAERERIRLLHSINTGEYVEPSKLTVGQFLKDWLKSYAKKRAKSTYDRYSSIVRRHLIPQLGSLNLGKLTALQIEAAYDRMLENGHFFSKGALTAQTVLHHHRCLHLALEQAVDRQLLARNPAKSAEPPRPAKRKLKVFNADQVEQLLDAMQGKRIYMPTLIAVTTGLRIGEVVVLAWEDVDLGEAVLWVPESKTPAGRRSIALPQVLVDALLIHRTEQLRLQAAAGGKANRGYVCAQADGRPFSDQAVRDAFARYRNKLDLPIITFHGLRHTHATLLLKRGIPLKVVSERLGHASIAITADLYQHVLENMQQAAAREMDVIFGSRPDKALGGS